MRPGEINLLTIHYATWEFQASAVSSLFDFQLSVQSRVEVGVEEKKA